MIHYFKPYDISKNLGACYNYYCNLVPNDDDWIVLMDGDTCFLTPDYGHLIQKAIKLYPEVGLFTCYTNRIGNLEQAFNGRISEDPNIANHVIKAKSLSIKEPSLKYLNNVISGHFMLFQKKTWREVNGFPEVSRRPNRPNLLGVDNRFSNRILKSGKKIALIENLYVFHVYRLLQGVRNKSHLL